jgi:hypothetical protein
MLLFHGYIDKNLLAEISCERLNSPFSKNKVMIERDKLRYFGSGGMFAMGLSTAVAEMSPVLVTTCFLIGFILSRDELWRYEREKIES